MKKFTLFPSRNLTLRQAQCSALLRSYSLTVFLIFLTGNFNAFAAWPPAGGDGSQGNPWQITTAAELADLADYVNTGNDNSDNFYKLMNDIDLFASSGGVGWNPIGNNSVIGANFQGNFDGNGKVITNLTINRGSTKLYWVVWVSVRCHYYQLGYRGVRDYWR